MKARELGNQLLRYSDWWARLAMAVVFGWFGVLKLMGLSPVGMLITPLFERLAPFMVSSAVMLLGIIEVMLAIGFLVPRLTRFVVPITILHLLGTCLTLVFTPEITWSSFLVPTFAGEFVLKNVVLLALSIEILRNRKLDISDQ